MRFFQVVCYDERGYINGYKDFQSHEMDEMLKYVKFETTNLKNRKVEIRRYDK